VVVVAMFYVKNLHKDFFTLDDVYACADFLQNRHPNNSHIQDKIRQQLQFLRDKGLIEFKGNGKYSLIK